MKRQCLVALAAFALAAGSAFADTEVGDGIEWTVRVRASLEIVSGTLPDAIEMEDYDVRLVATNARGEVRWSVETTPYSVRREPNSFRETGTPILGAGSDCDWGEFLDYDGWTTTFALPFSFPVGTQTVDSVSVSLDGHLELPDSSGYSYATTIVETPQDGSPHCLPSGSTWVTSASSSVSPYPSWSWSPWYWGEGWVVPCRFSADAARTTVFADTSVPGAVTFRWHGIGSPYSSYVYYDYGDNPIGNIPTPIDVSATLYADGTIRFSYGEGNFGPAWFSGDYRFDDWCHVAGQRLAVLFSGTGMSHAQDVVLTPRTYPPGISLSENGILFGRPWKAGRYVFDVVAEDSDQRTSRTFSLVVGENPDRPPVVESFSPEWGSCRLLPDSYFSRASTSSGTTVVGTSFLGAVTGWTVGETKTFAVSARDPEGKPLSYVWRVNQEPLEGETSSSFSYTASDADWHMDEWGDGYGYLNIDCIVSDGTWSELVGWRFDVEGTLPSKGKTWFVDVASVCAEPDGKSWETAFATLAQADDAAQSGDTVLVAPGVYSSAGRVDEYWRTTTTVTESGVTVKEEERVVETNTISFAGVELRSTDGPDVTVIDGECARPCFYRYYQSGGTLVGFTLRNGVDEPDEPDSYADGSVHATISSAFMHLAGCRIERCVVSNCVFGSAPFSRCELEDCTIVANRSESSRYDPLLSGCLLDNCVVAANETEESSVLSWCNLFHCTVAENEVGAVGTAALDAECRAYNTIVWNNHGPDGGVLNYQTVPSYVDDDGTVVPAPSAIFENCCLNGYHENKAGLVFGDPMLAGPLAGDARLRAGSSCIDAGSAEWVYVDSDIAGNPRVAGSAPDIGAWEGATASGHSVSVRVRGRGRVSPVSVLVPDGGSATYDAAGTDRPFRGFYDESGNLLSASSRWTAADVRSDRTVVAVFASELYADAENGDDANDGFSRGNPKKTIQAAVNAALEGETVFVAPGVYGPFRTDGKQIRITGEAGAAETIVDGGGTNRCATLVDSSDASWYWIPDNTTLVGLTLRNGFADHGGGACGGRLIDCTVVGNRATEAGGGLDRTTAEQCSILGNEVRPDGAPAEDGSFRRLYGGGAARSYLVNCIVAGNSIATVETNDRAMGGGVYGDYSSVNYCTIVDNRIDGPGRWRGTGVGNGFVRGCIVSGNDADGASREHYEGEPGGYLELVSTYVGDDPGFVDAAGGDYRLREDSPCIDAGALPANAEGADPGELDLDGNPRVRGKSIDQGCYESAFSGRAEPAAYAIVFRANGGTGTMAPQTVRRHAEEKLTANAFKRAGWVFLGWAKSAKGAVAWKNGAAVKNLAAAGATVTLYAVWADAATTTLVREGDNLQTAVDTAPDGGLVLVYPGTYAPIDATGRVLEIRAVFGPDSDAPDAAPTVIDGGDAVRCATLDEGVVLSGFTLRNGVADNGGGVKGGALENCRIEDCAATVAGGGAWGSALSRCTVSFCRADGNGGGLFEGSAENTVVENCDAALFGGGAFHATLTGCTVYGCGAETGAGVAGCTVRNSIVWENRIYAVDKKGVHKLGNCANVTEGKKTLFKNACTYTDSSPKPAGTGNLAKTPLFVDAANGDFRLQWTSPVKNKGRAALSLGDRDLGGLPRRIGAPDMGAHEVPDGTPVPADYDGDGIADAAYFDAPTATWIVMQSRDGLRVETFGDAKATPVPADYDGDGTADFATYSATAKAPAFRIRMQLGSEPEPVALGLKGATPLAADLDGDGKADPVVFQGNAKKPSFTAALSGGGTLLHVFGTKGAKAVAGDFDGDGKADIGCYTASASKPAFAMLLSGNNWDPPKPLRMTLGAKGSEPCCGDFDGDGLSDFAAYAGSAKTPILYRMFSTSRWRETRSLPFGAKGSRATTGDWDGDGVADPAIETRGAWWRVTRDWEIVPITAP